MNKSAIPVLSISGSDSTGLSGIQADIQTISELGAHAVTAITCLTVQNGMERSGMFDVPTEITIKQVSSIISSMHPKAIKVGLVRNCETIRLLRNEIIGCQRIVIAPGIHSSDGTLMTDDDSLNAIVRYLIPIATLLMLRCHDAERILGFKITTDDNMVRAAEMLHEMGARCVLLRGGQYLTGRLTALMYAGKDDKRFFTSYNTEGWQQHGVGGALSAAITTRMAMGDNTATAINNAHAYIHSKVVYAKESDTSHKRPIDLYNEFIGDLAEYYTTAHDVKFYSDRLCITSRYLSQITDKVVEKSPKQIIADFLTGKAKTYLETTRLTIQEISDKLGFSSQVIFCKFFRNQTDKSPTEYRRSITG